MFNSPLTFSCIPFNVVKSLPCNNISFYILGIPIKVFSLHWCASKFLINCTFIPYTELSGLFEQLNATTDLPVIPASEVILLLLIFIIIILLNCGKCYNEAS